jgi:hypothetical protein
MTSFVDDSGNIIDYPSGEDFEITKQCANWHEFKIKGDVTADFKIPNTSKNREALGYYGGQQIDSPAFPSIAFNVIRDGNRIMRGYFIIRGLDADFIYCFFVSGNSNWFNALKFNLKDIMYPDSYTVSYSSAFSRMAETDGIIFPLIDWSYNRQRLSNYFYLRQWPLVSGSGSGQDINRAFSQDVFPCIYLHTIVSGMARHGGIKIDGDLVNDPLFKKVIITPPGPDFSVSNEIVKKTTLRIGLSASTSPTTGNTVPFDVVQESGELINYDAVNYRYYVPVSGTYRLEFKIDYTAPQSAVVDFYLVTSSTSTLIARDSGTLTTPYVRSRPVWFNASAGDYVRWEVLYSSGVAPTINTRSNLFFQLEAGCPSSFMSTRITTSGAAPFYYQVITKVIPSAVIPDMKAVDLVKFLCSYFGCVCSYTEESKTLTINRVSSFQKEEADDWSDFFIKRKEVYDTNTAIKNIIQAPETSEEEIVKYNNGADVKYGGGMILSKFDFNEQRTIYTLPFGGSYDEKSLANPDSGAPYFLPHVHFYDIEEDQTTYYDYTSVSNFGNAGFFGVGAPPFVVGDLVRITGGSYAGYTNVVSLGATSVTCEGTYYTANATGRITKVTLSPVNSVPRMLVISDPIAVSNLYSVGSAALWIFQQNADTTEFDSASAAANYTSTSGNVRTAWFDKAKVGIANLDVLNDSLSIDQISNKEYNATVGERYHNFIERAYNNPKIEAELYLPTDIFYAFNFGKYIYLKTDQITGYFFVQKINGYKSPEKPVKVELIYID